jgi:hypothetical protein
MRRLIHWSCGLVLLAALVITGSHAEGLTLSADMTTDQETTPPQLTTDAGAPRPTPSGSATFVLNSAQTELSMSGTIFEIDVTGAQTPDVNDNLVAAHIHCCTPAGENPGANAPVVWGFFGTPFNDALPPSFVITPFATGVGGTFTSVWNEPEGNATTLSSQLPGILAGLAYINFHTEQNRGGEIRGAITVPEPATYALLVTGLGLISIVWWRQRRTA